jgi:serine/threonine protein kinase
VGAERSATLFRVVSSAGQTVVTGRGRAIGRYVIYDQVAVGGTARVHLARRVGPAKFSRIVVMKALKPVFSADEELRAMLADEAWLAARISHPNVVSVIDVEVEGDELWLALEYVHGETLSALLRSQAGKPVAPGVVATIMAGVLHGLHAAHELHDESGTPLDLVHRDVSPQNIIVGVDGVARVLDFGIAKAIGRSQATRDGEIKGKIAYMAPEQLFSEPVTRRTDLFATSIVMWEALTGRRLFMGETESETIVRAGSMQIPAPSSVVPLPPALDAVLLKGLARDTTQRYATAREMALAIEGSVELASATQVGAWVESLAADTLSARKRVIQRIERDAPSSEGGAPTPPVTGDLQIDTPAEVSGKRSRVPRRRGLIALFAVLCVAGFFAAALWFARSEPQPLRGTAVMVEKPIVPEPLEPVVTPLEEPKAALTPEPAPLPEPEPVKKRPRATRSATDKPDCDPPYEVDAQGHKKFKVQCL